MSKFSTTNKTFIQKRRNTIVMLAIVFTVLIAGYFLLRGTLTEEPATTTDPSTVELMPGEAKFGDSVLVFPRVDRKDLKSVKVHNPANVTYGEQYVDWGIGFAYNEEAKDYYGFFLEYQYVEIDEIQLSYFVLGAGYLAFTDRVAEITEESGYAAYGLEKDKATRLDIEKLDGGTHTVYIGKKAANGSYYVRSGDTYVNGEGETVERNIVYLLNATTSGNLESTVMTKPTEMLTKRVTFPVYSMFTSFIFQDSWGDVVLAFLPVRSAKSTNTAFGGSSLYYTVSLKNAESRAGYFSSSEFETRITIFEDFCGDAVMEYATEKVEGVDEETGEEYSYYVFSEEMLAKYYLDSASEKRMLFYTAKTDGSDEDVASEVYFSTLQPGGFYYAYSLNYSTIVRVPASTIDFLEWDFLDFVDSYPFRISIGYIDTLSVMGTIDGRQYSESFTSVVDADYIVKSAKAVTADKAVNLDLYKEFCVVAYSTYLRGEVPDGLDKEALMQGDPYAEVRIKTRDITVYATDELGNPTTKVEGVVKSVTRIFRFYRYSNERALMTVETIDANGKSSGETGDFYVLTSRLDKIMKNAEMLVQGIPFNSYDKE